MKHKNRQYFIDFDGTIVREDSLDLLFGRFANPKWLEYDQQWARGEIGSLEDLARSFATFEVTPSKLEHITSQLTGDVSFAEFIAWVAHIGASYNIISDGLDYIIEHFLSTQINLGQVRQFIISSRFIDGSVQFDSRQSSCPMLESCRGCALCKYLVTQDSDAEEKIYIGNGLSDRFGVLNCGIIYAKDSLAAHCSEAEINFYEYSSFADILRLEIARVG